MSESHADTISLLRDTDLMTQFDPMTVIDPLVQTNIISDQEADELNSITKTKDKLGFLLPLVEQRKRIFSFIDVLEKSRINRKLGSKLRQRLQHIQPDDGIENQEDPRIPSAFGKFQIDLSKELKKDNCHQLLLYFNCPPSTMDQILGEASPGLGLVGFLRQQIIIKEDDVKNLIEGLEYIKIKSALEIANQYQALHGKGEDTCSGETMSPFRRSVLNLSMREFSEDKASVEEIITDLASMNVLTKSEQEAIATEEESKKVSKFVQIIKRRPDEAFTKLKSVLKKRNIDIIQRSENRQALKDPERRKQLFVDIEHMRTFNVDSAIMSQFVRKVKTSYNILLLGKTGSGKSSTGNTLLGREVFKITENFFNSCTKTVELQELLMQCVTVNIMDTPGLFDTKKKGNIDILLEITKAALEFPKGIDVVLIVCRLGQPFTSEDQNTISEIERHFGDELYAHSILVFTHGNSLNKGDDLESKIRGAETLSDLSNKVSGRCIAIENRDNVVLELHKEVLLSACFQLIQQKNEKKYSHEIFQDVLKRQTEWKERDQKLDEVKKFIYDFVQNVMENSDVEKLELLKETLQLDPNHEESLQELDIISNNTWLLTESKETVKHIVSKCLRERKKLIELMIVRQKEKTKRLEAERQLTLQVAEQTIYEELMRMIDKFKERELKTLIQDGTLSAEKLRELHELVNIDEQSMASLVHKFSGINKLSLQSVLDVKVEERLQRVLARTRLQVKQKINEIVHKNARAFIRKYGKKEMINMKNQIKEGYVPPKLQKEIKSKLPSDVKVTDDELHDISKSVLQDNLQLIEDIIAKYCFPANARVVTERAGSISISKLRVGDKVLTMQSNNMLQYQDVFFIAHSDSEIITNYLKVETESGAELFISPNHCIPIGSFDNLPPASEIAVGNIIFTMQGHHVVPDKVTSITNVNVKGAYCPYTLNGTIVVNNVLASCYSSTVNPHLSHPLLYPLRMMYKTLPFPIYKMLFTKESMVAISETARKFAQIFDYDIYL